MRIQPMIVSFWRVMHGWSLGVFLCLSLLAEAGAADGPTDLPLLSPLIQYPRASCKWTIASIFLIVGLYALLRHVRRFGPGSGGRAGSSNRLTILEVKPMGHRQNLAVVAYEGQRLLLSVHPGGIEYLCSLTPASPSKFDSESRTNEAAAAWETSVRHSPKGNRQ
jgi:flagellar biogenesis protein FliO